MTRPTNLAARCARAWLLALVSSACPAFWATQARAQDEESGTSDPTFTFGEQAKVVKARWLATANLGLLITSGNSNITTFTGGAFVSWADRRNRFTFDGTAAYARQYTLTAVDSNEDEVIQADEIRSESSAGANNWAVRPRYDRFLSDYDTLYISPSATSDRLAGKELTYGGQLGYSRKVYVEDPHEVTAEVGYDFTYERYVEPPDSSLNVHSARLFVGYRLKLADDVFAQTSLEALSNIIPQDTPSGHIRALTDTRLNWKSMLTAKVWKNISGRFSFTARYDNWPAPRPPFDLPYAEGVIVPADKLDTQTEFAIVVNFL